MEDIIIQITASILLVIIVTAFILWLFLYIPKEQKLNQEKTKLQIKYLKLKIKYYDEVLDDVEDDEDKTGEITK